MPCRRGHATKGVRPQGRVYSGREAVPGVPTVLLGLWPGCPGAAQLPQPDSSARRRAAGGCRSPTYDLDSSGQQPGGLPRTIVQPHSVCQIAKLFFCCCCYLCLQACGNIAKCDMRTALTKTGSSCLTAKFNTVGSECTADGAMPPMIFTLKSTCLLDGKEHRVFAQHCSGCGRAGLNQPDCRGG